MNSRVIGVSLRELRPFCTSENRCIPEVQSWGIPGRRPCDDPIANVRESHL